MHQPKKYSSSLQQGNQGSQQLSDYISCVPDTHHSMQGTSPDQQSKAATSGNKQQLIMPWEEQHELPHFGQAGDSHWAPGPVGIAGARSYCQAPSWESKVAAVWGKPSSSSQQPTGIAAVELVDGGADVSGVEPMDISHWVKGHTFPAALVTGSRASGAGTKDSHWASAAPLRREAAAGSLGSKSQPNDDPTHAAAAHRPMEACSIASKTASPSGVQNTVEDSIPHCRHRCTGEHGAFLQTAATQQDQHQQTADIRAAVVDDRIRSCTGPSDGSGSPAVAAPCSADLMQDGSAAHAAGGDSSMPIEAEHCLATAGAGSMKRQLPVAYPPVLQAGADAGMLDVEDAADVDHRHQNTDDTMLSAEMPNLKKLRTRVQGLRVDSADDRNRDSSPAAADNMGGFMPCYGSPRVEQTMRSYPDLDCGSAKAANAGTTATKPSGLSRFAPAGGCPVSPAVAAADVYEGQPPQQQQHQPTRAQGGSMGGLGQAAASGAASQSAAAPGSEDFSSDEQWVKHNRELQLLKQQQDALRALLHQAEQQVRDPLLQEAEYLDAEMQAKVGDSAAGQAMASMQQDAASNKRTAESDAERVAAQMLAQEGGNWEKAMQRMLNLVQSTMQHGGSHGSSCSNPRMAQLKRSSSTASPIHRAASLAAAANEGAADIVELGQVPAEAGSSSQVLKRDLSRQGSSHWGLQRQEGAQGASSPYAAVTALQTSPYQAGPGTAGHRSPYPAAAAGTGGHNSPYAASTGAAAAAGPHNSPSAAGPMSAAKLAWPMVPASAVGSPVGSPACSPMVPTSAVGSPMAAAPDATATVGGISNMILPSTGGGAAVGCSPTGAGVCYGSPVANQQCVVGDGCSPCGSPGAAAVRGNSRSPACTSGRPKAGLVRQPSRMGPKPPRASVASITGGFGCAPGLSISAGGPAAYNTDATAAGLSVSAGGPAAFSADVAAAAVAGLSVSAGGPYSYNMGAAANPMSAQAVNVSIEAAQAQAAANVMYAAADYCCAAGNVSSSQHVEMEEAAADVTAAYAVGADQAAVQDAKPQQQQQLLPLTTTAAAAAAAFGKVPSVSVDQDLDDAAGWLFGENGLLPDTPGPVNLMNQQNKAVGQLQQQEQQQRQQQLVAAAGMGQSASLHQHADHHQVAVAPQHQTMAHTAVLTQAPMLDSSGGWPAAVQGHDAGPDYCHGTYNHMPPLAPVYHGPNTTAGAAAATAADTEAMTAAVPGAGGSWGSGSTPWQYMPSVQHQMQPAAVTASAVTAHEQYQQMQQQYSQEGEPAATAVPAAAIAHADDAAASKALGSDKDDLALLQVLLGWASDDA